MINNVVTVFDISFYQDNNYTPYKVDFIAMRANGGDGTILRAGQNLWVDSDYLDYARNADRIGFPRGAYWYYDSRVSHISQADLFANTINLLPYPALGIWADYEETYGGSYRGERYFKEFLERLRIHFPNKLIGIYTGPSYWREHSTSSSHSYFKDFPLWIANYNVDKPDIPEPWTDYAFWQFTAEGNGPTYGVESEEIDMNRFRGSFEEYKQMFGLTIETPPPNDTGEENVKATVMVNRVNIRNQPSAGGLDIGDLFLGDVVYGEIQNGWIYFSKVYRNNGSLDLLAGYSATANPLNPAELYMKLESVTEPTPLRRHFTLKIDGFRQVEGDLEPE